MQKKKKRHFKCFKQKISIWLLRKAFMLTTSGKQSTNNCEHITQWKTECQSFLSLTSWARLWNSAWAELYETR